VLLPDFVAQKRDGATLWVHRKFADRTFVDLLTNVDRWFDDPQCQIIKDEKKTKVGRLAVKIGDQVHPFYLKQFNTVSLRHRFLSLFGSSRAFRSLRGATILRGAGIPTVTPVAAVEYRACGALTKSVFISNEIAEGKTADAYWTKELQPLRGREGAEHRRRFLRDLAKLFRSLHAQHVYHDDLKDANILAARDAAASSVAFFLLDFDGVRRCSRLSQRRRLKNLVQLHRTLGRYMRRPEKLYFIKSYLGSAFGDRIMKRRLISTVLRQTHRVELIKARQAAEARAS
jgi:serine/threonine protein kinase